jgi:hypothetical protein
VSLSGYELDGEVADAPGRAGMFYDLVGFADADVVHGVEYFFQGGFHLGASHVYSDARVRAEPEAHVPVWLSIDH